MHKIEAPQNEPLEAVGILIIGCSPRLRPRGLQGYTEKTFGINRTPIKTFIPYFSPLGIEFHKIRS